MVANQLIAISCVVLMLLVVEGKVLIFDCRKIRIGTVVLYAVGRLSEVARQIVETVETETPTSHLLNRIIIWNDNAEESFHLRAAMFSTKMFKTWWLTFMR